MELATIKFLNQIFIASEIVFFNIFGLFGNVNFIVLTATNTKLRSKSSYLQCALCLSHIFCLLFELPNAGLLFTGIQLKRNECFAAISIYIFFICAQAVIILMMTLDIFIIVFLPAFYQTIATWKYLTGMLTIPVLYSSGIVAWGFAAMNDEVVMFCNPPLGLYPTVSRFWTFSNVIINSITLVLFISLILVFYYKGKKQKSDTRKIMKRLKVSILFFISTWYVGLLAADLFNAIGLSGDLLMFMMSNLVFFVLVSYSQFFYIVIWRSPEYRNAFLLHGAGFHVAYHSNNDTQ